MQYFTKIKDPNDRATLICIAKLLAQSNHYAESTS